MNLSFTQDDLRPLVETIVDQTLERVEAAQGKLPAGRLAYPETEAAELLGVAPHKLRDCRLRGEVTASKVGKSIVYQRDELVRFLSRQRAG